MNCVACFEKVSFEQFYNSYKNCFGIDNTNKVKEVYDEINMPERATVGSAGYDFNSTIDFKLAPGETIMIPTGIRSKIEDGWVLCLYPRSGLGFKYRLQLNNTVGIVDSDYYNADNEGHIFIKITNDSNEGKSVEINRGKSFAQGIFMPFGITYDDKATGIRIGGFNSTGK